MRRFVLILTGILGCAALSHADMFEQGAIGFTSDTRQVFISSNTAAPTQILTRDSYIRRTWIINNSSFTVLLSTVSNTFNATSVASIPPCVTNDSCTPWTPDGPTVPYWGPMYAVMLGTATTNNSLSVFRTK